MVVVNDKLMDNHQLELAHSMTEEGYILSSTIDTFISDIRYFIELIITEVTIILHLFIIAVICVSTVPFSGLKKYPAVDRDAFSTLLRNVIVNDIKKLR